MVFEQLSQRCLLGATDAINRVPTPLYGPARAGAGRSRSPACQVQGLSPSQGRDQL
jgi:hypothetical protein